MIRANIEQVNYNLLIAICLALSLLTHFLISIFISQPYIFGDEVTYKTMAYAFYKYGDLYGIKTNQMAYTVDIPNFLYQLLISISFYFESNFLIIIKLINSTLISLTILPIYYLLREFSKNKFWIFITLLTIIFIPGMNYSITVMPESLFFLIFLYSFYTSFKFFITNKLYYLIITSILLALLFLTKPHAVATILGVSSVFLISIILYIREKKYSQAWFYFRSFLILISILIAVIFFLSHLLAHGFNLGGYNHTTDFDKTIEWKGFLRNLLAHISSIGIIYIIPILLTFYAVYSNIQFKNHLETKKAFYFSIILLMISIFVFSMVIKFTNDIAITEHYGRIHARYYLYLYPLFIVSFFINYTKIFSIRKLLITSIIFIYIIAFSIFFKYFSQNIGFISDNPQFTWLLILQKNFISISILLILLSANIAIVLSQDKRKIYAIMLASYFFVSNCFFLIGLNKYHYGNALNFYKETEIIKSQLGFDYSKKVAIFDHQYETVLRAVFWLPYYYTTALKNITNSVITKEMIPVESEAVVLVGDYNIDFSYASKTLKQNNIQTFFLDFSSYLEGMLGGGWTAKNFSFNSNNKDFNTLVLKLSDWQPIIPSTLIVTANNQSHKIKIDNNTKEIRLPSAKLYKFYLSNTFNPKKLGLNQDDRDLGLNIKHVYLE